MLLGSGVAIPNTVGQIITYVLATGHGAREQALIGESKLGMYQMPGVTVPRFVHLSSLDSGYWVANC
jgi:hypothetical protein